MHAPDLRGADTGLTRNHGRRTRLRPAHPLYGEVLRRGCPPHRQRRRCRELAAAVERTG